MLKEVNVENIQVEETSMLIKVNVERYEVVAVNICYFIACFCMDGYGGRILLDLYSRTFLKKL